MNDFPERPRLVWEPSAAYVRAASLVETFAADCERVWSFGMDQTMRQRLHMLVLDALETPLRAQEPAATADPIGRRPGSDTGMDPWHNDGAPPAEPDHFTGTPTSSLVKVIGEKVAKAKGRKKRSRKAKAKSAEAGVALMSTDHPVEAAPAPRPRGRPRKVRPAEAQPEGEAAS
jgi:hypothetical protein